MLQPFGFAYDVDLNRAVAVFARYLADLTPEHQRIWQARELGPNFKLHPDYWRQSIGEWPVGISMFTAFLDEMAEVNNVSQLIGRPGFFRQEYGGERRPPEFGFLVRPTLREFQGFVHLLDKMLSDNINIAFFGRDVPRTTVERQADGTQKEEVKGSLRLLDEWLAQNFRPQDPEPIRLMLEAFREVRTHRRRPAHAVDDNVFDVSYLNRQRELMLGAYHGIRVLRQVLQLHPLAHEYAPPEHLNSGTVWSY